jgi:hypothetical protein
MVQPCPLTNLRALEITVLDEVDAPLADIAVRLRRADGLGLTDKTDRGGRIRFEGLDSSEMEICLPSLDGPAWALESSQPLPAERAIGGSRGRWEALAKIHARPALRHEVEPGDTITNISARHGMFPGDVWGAAENAALRERRDHPDVLSPGDVVVVPARRPRWEKVHADSHCVLRRRGVPARLRVRFLDAAGAPRAGLRYLLQVSTASGAMLRHRAGETLGNGFVDQPVPPDTVRATITLGTGAAREVHEIEVGHLHPVDSVHGLQERLNNLGYSCPESGTRDKATIEALRTFQRDHGLEVTGTADAPTRARLKSSHGS